MNKQRKTSHILNVFQYDADGHVVLPASLTLTIAPGSEDNNSKVPTTAWVRALISSLGYVTLASDQTITGLKTIVRSGDVLNFKIGTDTLYGLKVAYNQNELVPSGEATWSFVNTFNRNGTGFSVTPVSFFRGVLVTGERLLSASVNANLLDYYSNNPSGRYPVYAYNTGVQQFSTGIIVGKTTGVVNAATGAISDLPSGVVGNFGGRVIGSNAVNSNEFVTLTQLDNYVPTSRTLTINGTTFDLSANRTWTIPAGVTSFNTRTGAITLTSGDVTGALGYTPYNATNPSGYTTNTGTVTSVGGTGTVSGLSLSGTVTGSGNLTLGGTLTLTSGNVTTALGYTPYNSSNPNGYISSYTETDTLASVTGRGATTSSIVTFTSTTSGGSVIARCDASVADWRGRIGHFNATADKSVWFASYNGFAVVGAHNFALNAWADLLVNCVDNSGSGGTVRLAASAFVGSNAIIHAGNIGSQSVSNATTAGGLAVHTGRNNEANKIVRTQENGYVFFGYINSTSGNENNNSNADRVWGTNGSDDYLRTYRTSALSVGYAASAGSATTSSQVSINYNNDSNSTYQLLWGSGNSVYGTAQVYINPSSDVIYAGGYRGSGNVGGTGEATWHPAGIYSGSTQWLYGTTYRNNATTFNQGNLYFDGNFGYGMIGLYSSTRYQGVFAMGDAYKLPVDGSSPSNLYGITWSHPNAGGVAGNLNTHGALFLENGTFMAAISGSIRSRDDMRAPIFYDSNNTGYYFDGASTSVLFDLTIVGASHKYLYINPGNGYEAMVRYNGGTGSGWYGGKRTAGGINSTNDFHFYSEAVGADVFGISTGGTAISSGDMRSPIFYDSNNTGFYLDPNNTSKLSTLNVNNLNSGNVINVGSTNNGNESIATSSARGLELHSVGDRSYWIGKREGAWTQPLDVAFYTGIRYHAHNAYNGHRFFTTGYDSTESFSIGNGDNNVRVANTIFVSGDARAPIFYDQNNTGFYLDPNGSSNLNTVYSSDWYYLNGGGGLYFSSYGRGLTSPDTTGSPYGNVATAGSGRNGWHGYAIGSRHCFMSTTADNVGVHDTARGWIWYWNGSSFNIDHGFTTIAGSTRSPIFYDSANTAYYLDPNSGSYLAGSLEIANGYFLTNGVGGSIRMSSAAGSFGGYFQFAQHAVIETIVGGYHVYVLSANGNGVVKFDGAQSWSAHSDRRIKTIHSLMENNLSKLESINPIYYSFNNFADDKNRIGLVAQEVQEHFPELVTLDPKTDYLTLDYTGLIPVLLGAIKELKNKVEVLESQL